MVKISRYQGLLVMFFSYLFRSSSIVCYPVIAIAFCLTMAISPVRAQTINQTIKGITGGNNNSGDCGYIADKPNYVLNLSQQAYSLNVELEANSGKPSLLILGPGTSDRFCVLGAPNRGQNAKMGGVWAPGKYLIYIGDAPGNKNPFTLKIVNKK